MAKHRYLITIVISILLFACSSTPPTRHYVLQSLSSAKTTELNDSIGIGPITVASYLDRPQLVRNNASTELQLAEFDRWGEPLAQGISRVLTQNFVTLSNNEQIRRFPWRGDEQPNYALKVHVLTMDVTANSASIELHWSLRSPGQSQPLAEGHTRYQQQSRTENPADTVYSYSQLLAEFSQAMIEEINKVATKH